MIEGAYFETLGFNLIVERAGNKVRKVFFSNEQPSRKSQLAEELIKHVTQGNPSPNVELDLSGFHEFRKKVSWEVMNFPRGRTVTYGEVAVLCGHPGAARAVGQVMAANPFAIIVPCHRVVAKRGLGGYFWGIEMKRKLLDLECQGLE